MRSAYEIVESQLPCNDCLVLSACKHKGTIECHMLYNFITLNASSDKYKIAREKLGEFIPLGSQFPNTLRVRKLTSSRNGDYVWV